MNTDSTGRSLTGQVVIVGAGQAGLAVGRSLIRRGVNPVVLDAGTRPGDSWRNRWDSLRLFTPAEHDGLPGSPFPASKGSFPTKDEMADYLEWYASSAGLEVTVGTRVTAAVHDGARWRITTDHGEFTAAALIAATGTNTVPHRPAFAADLDPGVFQLHSSEYRNPDQIPPGEVLVVGAGTSGAEIALELAANHTVSIAGRPTVHIPDVVLRRAGSLYWRFLYSVLTRDTPIGRRAAKGFEGRGAPLIRISMAQLDDAHVRRLPRVEAVTNGVPVLADGQPVPSRSVVWATGYRSALEWIGSLPRTDDRWPAHERGVATGAPDLYFLGIPFQYGLASTLVGGIGRDAEYVADRILAAPASHPRRDHDTQNARPDAQ